MEKNPLLIKPIFSLVHFILITFFFLGCASPGYRLKPTSEKPEYRNGIALETRVTPKCVFQAGFQDSNSEEMLVFTRITAKSKGVVIDPERFSVHGTLETVEQGRIAAKKPEEHLQSLKSSAELYEARGRMETHQGIEELATLSSGKSDSAIQEARVAYRRKQDEAEAANHKALRFRARIAEIQDRLLRKNSLQESETLEGLLIFPSRFKDSGRVQLISENEGCEGALEFDVSRR